MTRPGPARARVVGLLVAALCLTAFASGSIPRTSAQSAAGISIQNFAFNPNSITLVIGVNNTVTWTNHDSATHTVTADDNSWGSGDLVTGATYTHTFSATGTFGYHCSIHPYMTGTVIVKAAGSTSASTTTSTASSSSATQSQVSLSTTKTVTSSASSSSTAAVPEFPFQGTAVVVVALVLAASYFVFRQSQKKRTPAPSASP